MGDTQVGREDEVSRALYDEHAGALLTYVQRLMHGDRQLAEDVVQETLLRAWQHAGQLPAEARRPWLFTTARHLIIDAYRARNARPAETSADVLGLAVDDEALDSALDAVLLIDALHALSAEHRSVLFDCYYRGNTAAQIAAARGLPPGTVRSRIHYALRALRLALEERGVSGT
ncbi:MAG TPA: sigma-70 family RNA polymerase sigma factor [Jatrophihabitans sp.]|nr:sigma-70 family RNA polymerase sigma factor [Jatrophihabitans sp.]